MKVTIGQINTTPGDFDGNTAQILQGITKAGQDDADVVLFPELSICGYRCRDMVYQSSFLDQNYAALAKLGEKSTVYPNLHIVVGYVGRNVHGKGKPFTNSAAVIKNGAVIAKYDKQLICHYDIFDEQRYFEAGTQPCILEINRKRIGIAICEDIWHTSADYHHHHDPLEIYRNLGVDGLLVLNSSPFYSNKWSERANLLLNITDGRMGIQKPIPWVVYCNQYGGQDEIVFDGHSFVVAEGEMLHDSRHGINFQTINVEKQVGTPQLPGHVSLSQNRPDHFKELYKMLVLGLEQYVYKTGFTDIVLGSSGGIDSALVAALACEALGAEHVHCLRMPSKWSSGGSLDHSAKLHQNLGCHEYTVPIHHEGLLSQLDQKMGFSDDYHPVAKENIQARLRAIAVMHMSNAKGYLPLTTGNKTEIALGYCTVNGDMVGGYNPIGDLYKKQVYALANWINRTRGETIPQEIIDKAPSAELAPGQTDEGSLKLSYAALDAIVESYIEDHISSYTEFKKRHSGEAAEVQSEEQYNQIIDRIDRMEFKRNQAAPIIKVSRQAFGTGRRMPIATNKTMPR